MIAKRWLVLPILTAAMIGAAGVSTSYASPSDTLTFVAQLDGSQPVPPSGSSATGTATLQIDTVNKTMTTDEQWSGLSAPADRSHVHSGVAGQPTSALFFHELIDNPFSLVDEVLPSLVDCGDGFVGCAPTSGSIHDVLDISNGYDTCDTFQCVVDLAVPDGFYIDMHTFSYASGEIRGQLGLVPSQVVGFFPPASKPTWKAPRTVPIKFLLTDPNGATISPTMAAGLLSPTCRVKLSATGPSPLAPTCVGYNPAADEFFYDLKLAKAAGTETFTVTVTYPSTTYTIAKTGSATIIAK